MKFSPSTNGFYIDGLHQAIPADAVSITEAEHAALFVGQAAGQVICAGSDGRPILKPAAAPTLEVRVKVLLLAVDAHLNAAARAKGYDSIITASLRAAYPGPFHDEGVAYATWMDQVYAACYALLAQFEAGDLAEPTLVELIAMLPTLQLPS